MTNQTEVTLTLPASEAVQIHIEHIQATLARRNARIEALEMQVQEALTGEPNQKALRDAYRRGWKEAASTFMNATQAAKQALSTLHGDAFQTLLSVDKIEAGK